MSWAKSLAVRCSPSQLLHLYRWTYRYGWCCEVSPWARRGRARSSPHAAAGRASAACTASGLQGPWRSHVRFLTGSRPSVKGRSDRMYVKLKRSTRPAAASPRSPKLAHLRRSRWAAVQAGPWKATASSLINASMAVCAASVTGSVNASTNQLRSSARQVALAHDVERQCVEGLRDATSRVQRPRSPLDRGDHLVDLGCGFRRCHRNHDHRRRGVMP